MDAFLEIFQLENLGTLLMLIFLQAVLGFDNLLYISIESKRVQQDKQQYVRRIGISMAIILRIVLLFVLVKAIAALQDPLFTLPDNNLFTGKFSGHALIVLGGGGFIIYTALKEISHMLTIHDLEGPEQEGNKRTVQSAIFWIIVMNLIFSFDSILGAIALTAVKDPNVPNAVSEVTPTGMWIMSIAIIASGILMIVLADRVSTFLQKNRMYEVLGLFVLFIVGIMLVSEGGHLAHIELGTYRVEAMPKSTFYFVIIVLVIVDVIQGRYQKKLDLKRTKQAKQTSE